MRVTEIFFSLQGESRSVGWPTVFIRLTGCPLRCHYCDTAYAFTGGNWLTIDDVMVQVAGYSPRYVTVTGGEPLAQKNCLPLLTALCDKGYDVSLETSGAMNISNVDNRVVRVMDIKTPGSGEKDKNRLENITDLNKQDQVKFVICSKDDYLWARDVINQYNLDSVCEILMSPSYQQLAGKELAEWILADNLPVRFQLQLHKILWGDTPGK